MQLGVHLNTWVLFCGLLLSQLHPNQYYQHIVVFSALHTELFTFSPELYGFYVGLIL